MFERLCLRQHRFLTFVHHYASREVSWGMLTQVCRAKAVVQGLSLTAAHYKIACDLLRDWFGQPE